MSSIKREIVLEYGKGAKFTCEIDPRKLFGWHKAPSFDQHASTILTRALEHPLEYPPPSRAVVPGDSVVLALQTNSPHLIEVIDGLTEMLTKAGVAREQITLLVDQEQDRESLVEQFGENSTPPRIVVHDSADETRNRYLASTAHGERVYLAEKLIDADFVITVGEIGFDSVLGYRGTNSALFPQFSNAEAIAKTRGGGHRELVPEDDRPLRQLVDEVGWLLGVQFTVQLVPGDSRGPSSILCGLSDAVLREGKRQLNEHWRFDVSQRSDLVVAGVNHAVGYSAWHGLAQAATAAKNVVKRGGNIALLTDFALEDSPGLNLLRQLDDIKDARKYANELPPREEQAVNQFLSALDWANLYLLSPLEADFIEELSIIPLEAPFEVKRLIDREASCIFIGGAQHVYTRVE